MSAKGYVNKRLKETFGVSVHCNRPLFRVVFSEGLTERRCGEYEDWTDSGIFIRRRWGVFHAEKYSYLEPQFVLERLIEFDPDQFDVLQEKRSYEPIHALGFNPDGSVKQPKWEPIRMALNLLMNGTKQTAEQYVRDFESERKRNEEKQIVEDAMLLDEESDLSGLESGESVLNAGVISHV